MELPDALSSLVRITAARTPPVPVDDVASFVAADVAVSGAEMYANRNDRLGIDFGVRRLAFPGIQTLDPRVVRIQPGKNNELHKHAHETIFVVMEGRGEVVLGDKRVPVAAGAVAFVPRWVFHQTINTGDTDLVILAITDFGFAKALLGDYDRAQRLRHGGVDAAEGGQP